MIRVIVHRINFYRNMLKWRKNNAHNKTSLVRAWTYPTCIEVGNYTYGPIDVEMSHPDYHLRIGNFCSIAKRVTFILSSDHPTQYISTFPFKVMCTGEASYEAISKGDIIVEDDVWIGYGATILSGVRIGQGAIVSAGAVVTKDVPPYAIVGGVPAKVIKYRFPPHIVDALMEVDYEKLTKELVAEHTAELYQELTDVKQLDWMPRKGIL